MSKMAWQHATHHPEDGLLLRYIDGELPARKMRQVERHVEACWQCRTEIEDLQRTVADCVRYRKNVLAAHLPPPPQPWQDLSRDFARIDDSWSGDPWLVRVARLFRGPAIRPWAITAVASLLIGLLIFHQLRQTPAVEAAALLKRAVAVGAGKSRSERTIQIRTKAGTITRSSRNSHRASLSRSTAALETRFALAGYDWEDPLSAKAYADWRDGLASKWDQVTTVADPESPSESCYRIRTSTPQGELAEASLMLRTTDLYPVEARLEFRDREWVELTEITDASARDGAPPAVTSVMPPLRRAEPSRPVAASSGNSASISEELRVLAALHEVGADLGDPVEVTRSEGRILVSGMGVPPQRQTRIRQALDGLPNVSVQFAEPATAPVPEEPASPPTAATTARARTRIEKQFGGRADFERFSSHMLDRDEALMARVYALRAVAQRFPTSAEAAMNAQDRQVLRGIAREHVSAIDREAADVQHLLQPVLISIGASAPAAQPAASSDWQTAAEDLFRSSRRVEVLLSRILGVSAGEGTGERLPSDLLTVMNELRANLDRCQKLLTE